MNMMQKNNNFIFFIIFMLSMIMIMISNTWLNMWIYLEINLMMFIFLNMNYKNYKNLESSLMYFLIQTIASIILMFSLIITMMNNYTLIIILFSIFLKMGMAPFHFWMILIIDKMNWIMIYLLLVFQKIGPLFIFNQYNNKKTIIYFMIFSMLIGSILGLNFSSLKKIMAYSSINQLSWIVTSMILLNKMFKLYFLMYMYMMMVIIYSFNFYNLKFIYNILNLKKIKFLNMFMFCNLLSLGGLPPFMGFFPKLMIIKLINNTMMMMLMIMFTMISLFYYIRIMISTMLINSMKLNIMKKNNMKLNFLMKISMINNLILMMMMMIY